MTNRWLIKLNWFPGAIIEITRNIETRIRELAKDELQITAMGASAPGDRQS